MEPRSPIQVDLDELDAFADLVAHVRGPLTRRRSGPRVVAIDGRSGVGKSTLAARLAESAGATVLDGDAFFAGGVALRTDPVDARVATCIDWRRQRSVLLELRAGRSASFHAFDWDAFDGSLESRPTIVESTDLLVVEGVYSARRQLADLVDLRILLRVPDEVRLGRLRAREGGIDSWAAAWHEAEVWYFAHEGADLWFDLIVEGPD